MSIIRVHKKIKNFVVMQKECLTDKTLSWGARGIHSFLLAQSDKWNTSISGLVACGPSKKHAIRGFIKELKEKGYVKAYTKRSENGQIAERGYIVYELPYECLDDSLESKSRPQEVGLESDSQAQAKLDQVNQPLINNNITINNKQKQKAPAEFLIAKDLTLNQHKEVLTRFRTKQLNFLTYEQETWLVAIEAELINKNSFQFTEQEFSRKLNTILSQAESGRWAPTAYLNKKENEVIEKREVENAMQAKKMQELSDECRHAAKMIGLLQTSDEDSAKIWGERLKKFSEELSALSL
jgi:hypothetical protein